MSDKSIELKIIKTHTPEELEKRVPEFVKYILIQGYENYKITYSYSHVMSPMISEDFFIDANENVEKIEYVAFIEYGGYPTEEEIFGNDSNNNQRGNAMSYGNQPLKTEKFISKIRDNN